MQNDRRNFISSILGGAVALVLAPFVPKATAGTKAKVKAKPLTDFVPWRTGTPTYTDVTKSDLIEKMRTLVANTAKEFEAPLNGTTRPVIYPEWPVPVSVYTKDTVRDASGLLQYRQSVDTDAFLTTLPQNAYINLAKVPSTGVKTVSANGRSHPTCSNYIVHEFDDFIPTPEDKPAYREDRAKRGLVQFVCWPHWARQVAMERQATGDHTKWIFKDGQLRDPDDDDRLLNREGQVWVIHREEVLPDAS